MLRFAVVCTRSTFMARVCFLVCACVTVETRPLVIRPHGWTPPNLIGYRPGRLSVTPSAPVSFGLASDYLLHQLPVSPFSLSCRSPTFPPCLFPPPLPLSPFTNKAVAVAPAGGVEVIAAGVSESPWLRRAADCLSRYTRVLHNRMSWGGGGGVMDSSPCSVPRSSVMTSASLAAFHVTRYLWALRFARSSGILRTPAFVFVLSSFCLLLP